MIGMFIGGFITGAFVCFFTLFIIAICSIKSKERQIKEVMGAVKSFDEPIDYKNYSIIRRKKGSPRISKLENYMNNNVKKDGVKYDKE